MQKQKLSKDEISEILNEFFGFKIKWDKVPKRDLEKLYEFLNDPKNIINRLLTIMGYEEFIKTVNNVVLHKVIEDRPVRRFLKNILFGGEED